MPRVRIWTCLVCFRTIWICKKKRNIENRKCTNYFLKKTNTFTKKEACFAQKINRFVGCPIVPTYVKYKPCILTVHRALAGAKWSEPIVYISQQVYPKEALPTSIVKKEIINYCVYTKKCGKNKQKKNIYIYI